MATYIIAIDKSVHADNSAATSAITGAGGSVLTTFNLNLTFKVDCTAEQLANISGVAAYSLESETLTATTNFNTDHLKFMCNEPGSLSTAYNPSSTGSGQHIYLVDTGIDLDHDEFSGKSVNNLYSSFSGDYSDSTGHGTIMASLIIGNNVGVSKDATIHNVKALNSNNYSGTVGEMVNALDAILVHHNANDSTQVKVVNICWTTSKNSLIDLKFNELEDNNLIVVCSAGNDGVDVDQFSPAGLDRVITVGAHNEDYTVGNAIATSYVDGSEVILQTNLGEELDIYALGSNVSVPSTSNTSLYSTAGGTSVSSALIGGLTLQYIDAYSSKDARTIKSYLVQEGIDRASLSIYINADLLTACNVSDALTLKRSVGVSPQIGELRLSTSPSGLILTMANNSVANANVEINSEASNVSILSFSPVPPFVTWNNSGLVEADTSNATNMANVTVPGIYHFAVRGTVANTTLVEEYSIGIYETDVSELDESNEYYYDSDNESYDQVINFSASKNPQP